MSDFEINLTGNLTKKALEGAAAVDTHTAALRANEKALAATQSASARAVKPPDLDKWKGTQKGASPTLGAIKKLPAPVSFKEIKDGQSALAAVRTRASEAGAAIGGKLAPALSAVGTGAKVAGVALGVTAVAAVTLGSKLLGLAKDATTLGVSFADAGRSARLLNEAADIAGGTHKQLTGIIEDARRRSDLGRDAIAGYARQLRILGFDSRKTQLVLSAMAIAETTLGTGASSAVKGIAEQSRAMRRFTLGVRDAYGEYTALRAAGLTKADLFAELARSTGRNIGSVRDALGKGQISIKAGLSAIDAALRRKYGGTAQAQAMSLTSQFRRMSEDFQGLFAGADIEPLLRGLKSITSIFSADTASGQAFAKIVSGLFTELGKVAEALGPDIKEALLSLSAEAAKPGGIATMIRGWISDAKELGETIKTIADGIKTIASAASGAKSVFKIFVRDKGVDLASGIQMPDDAKAAALTAEANKSGRALTAGIAAGVRAGEPEALRSISDLSAHMQAAFKAANEIKSPSRAYSRESEQIPAGAGVGVRKATPVAVSAIVDMSERMQSSFRAPAPGSLSRGGDTYEINVTVDARGAGAEDIARVVRSELVSAIKTIADRGPQPRAA